MKRAAFAAALAATVCACSTGWLSRIDSAPAGYRIPIEYNRPIVVRQILTSGDGDAAAVKSALVRFELGTAGLRANIMLFSPSVPGSEWKARISLLDEQQKTLAKGDAIFANSGKAGDVKLEAFEQTVEFGPAVDVPRCADFVIRLDAKLRGGRAARAAAAPTGDAASRSEAENESATAPIPDLAPKEAASPAPIPDFAPAEGLGMETAPIGDLQAPLEERPAAQSEPVMPEATPAPAAAAPKAPIRPTAAPPSFKSILRESDFDPNAPPVSDLFMQPAPLIQMDEKPSAQDIADFMNLLNAAAIPPADAPAETAPQPAAQDAAAPTPSRAAEEAVAVPAPPPPAATPESAKPTPKAAPKGSRFDPSAHEAADDFEF